MSNTSAESINTPCVVARHINNISLNGYEYLLDSSGETQVFSNKEEAIVFLREHGCSDEEIYFFRFFHYNQWQNNIYEEL